MKCEVWLINFMARSGKLTSRIKKGISEYEMPLR
jgi:hypothetical protein